jgi:hypothetical protein
VTSSPSTTFTEMILKEAIFLDDDGGSRRQTSAITGGHTATGVWDNNQDETAWEFK